MHEVLYKIPWPVVLMMLNDRTRLKNRKADGRRPEEDGETYDPILSEAEANAFLKL